jgi:hypothetical protein
MPRFSKPTMLGTVPYLASPTANFGSIFHLEHTQSTKSRIGVLSVIEAGATNALRTMRALPPSTT